MLLLFLWAGTAAALCSQGNPGADGLSCNVTITHNTFTQCDIFTFLVGSQRVGTSTVCNITGPAGPIGPQGNTGPAVSIVDQGNGCLSLGGHVLCNGTGLSTTPQCNVGTIRSVDGICFPLTRLGMQQAINAVKALPSGGTVLLQGDIVSDGTAVNWASKVIIDLNGFTFFMHPTIAHSGIVANELSEISMPLVADSPRGNSTVFVNATLSQQIVPLQLTVITCTGGSVFTSPVSYASRVIMVDTSTGTVYLEDALGFDALVSYVCTLRVIDPIRNIGLRNGFIHGNGNTAPNSEEVLFWRAVDSFIEGVTFIGGEPNAAAIPAGLWVNEGHNNIFRDIVAKDFVYGALNRDLTFNIQTGCSIEQIKSFNSAGFGPAMAGLHVSVVTGFIVADSKSRGLRIDFCTDSVFNQLVSTNNRGHNGDGVRVAFGTAYCVFDDVVTTGNQEFGLVVGGGAGSLPDQHNQFKNIKSYNNGLLRQEAPQANLYLLDTGPMNNDNYFEGDVQNRFYLSTPGRNNVLFQTGSAYGPSVVNLFGSSFGIGGGYHLNMPVAPTAPRTVNFYDTGSDSYIELGIARHAQLNGDLTLQISDSGWTFQVNNGAYTITLPYPWPGTHFEFYGGSPMSFTVGVVTQIPAHTLKGYIVNNNTFTWFRTVTTLSINGNGGQTLADETCSLKFFALAGTEWNVEASCSNPGSLSVS